MRSELISVITVCYNASKEIEKTICSVASQSYKNIEYIVIDGNSTDGTKDLLYKHKDVITKIVSEPDRGLYDAMNKGIALATGGWICFMNAGDVFTDNDVLTNVFSHEIPKDTGIIYGDVILDYAPYGKVYKRLNNLVGKEQATGICHQATLTRTVLLKATKYDLSYRIFADMNAFYTFWERGTIFTYVPVAMATFEGFEGVSSTKVYKCFKESVRMRGVKWYQLAWWRGLMKVVVKEIMRISMSPEAFRENKYKRILSRYEPYNT